jgi:hypothetical protein
MLSLKTDAWTTDKNMIMKFKNDLNNLGIFNISLVDYATFKPPVNEYL